MPLDDAALDDWDGLMADQVALAIEHEALVLDGIEGWRRARHILDVGTGTAVHLVALMRRFPGRRYTGLDIDARLIERAAGRVKPTPKKLPGTSVELVHTDFLAARGTFDALMLRMFLQHQRDIPAAAAKCSALLAPGGVAVFIGANDEGRITKPPIAQVDAFFAMLQRRQSEHGLDRRATNEVRAHLAGHGLEVVVQREIAIPIETPARKRLFSSVLARSARIAAKLFEFEIDQSDLEAALTAWVTIPSSMACFSERILVVQKPA